MRAFLLAEAAGWGRGILSAARRIIIRRHNPLLPEIRKEAILTSVSDRPAHRWRHRIFVGYVALMLLVFLVPVPATPLAESNHVDKLVHFAVFLGFALLFHIDKESRPGWTLLVSFAFAGGIELVQWGLPYREGDWWDFVAGAAGATLGSLLVLLIERQAHRAAGGRRPPV